MSKIRSYANPNAVKIESIEKMKRSIVEAVYF